MDAALAGSGLEMQACSEVCVMHSFVGLRRVAAAAFVAASLAAPAFAQVSTFDLSGTVLDPSRWWVNTA
jgi:hypothetical protein